jgi:hypothetical protein
MGLYVCIRRAWGAPFWRKTYRPQSDPRHIGGDRGGGGAGGQGGLGIMGTHGGTDQWEPTAPVPPCVSPVT